MFFLIFHLKGICFCLLWLITLCRYVFYKVFFSNRGSKCRLNICVWIVFLFYFSFQLKNLSQDAHDFRMTKCNLQILPKLSLNPRFTRSKRGQNRHQSLNLKRRNVAHLTCSILLGCQQMVSNCSKGWISLTFEAQWSLTSAVPWCVLDSSFQQGIHNIILAFFSSLYSWE